MAGNHADSHDFDKLERWVLEMASAESSTFPAYAVFLVGPEDRYAHNVFREFRSRFGQLGAGFQHLVIFGQHGVSTTVRGLMASLSLPEDSLPLLALFTGRPATAVHTLPLAKGGSGEETLDSSESWGEVLSSLAGAAEEGAKALDAEPISGLDSRPLRDGTLEAMAGGLLAG